MISENDEFCYGFATGNFPAAGIYDDSELEDRITVAIDCRLAGHGMNLCVIWLPMRYVPGTSESYQKSDAMKTPTMTRMTTT